MPKRRPDRALTLDGMKAINAALALKGRERKCTAKSGTCKRWAIKGGVVCATHGGSAPQVKKAAKKRLMEMIDPTITRLQQLIDQTDHLPTALGAATHLLNRTLGKAGNVEREGGTGAPIIKIGIAIGGMPLGIATVQLPPGVTEEDARDEDDEPADGDVVDD